MGRLGLCAAAMISLSLPFSLLGQSSDLGSALEVVGELHLQETLQALVVSPRLIPDPAGWLYWDAQRQEGRLYAPSGELIASFGGPGEGPGEFSGLMGIARLDDRLVASDRAGRISLWAESGDSLVTDFASGIVAPQGFAATDDGRIVVLSAPELGTQDPPISALHIVNPTSQEEEGLPFAPPLDAAYLSAGRSILSPAPVVHDGSVYVALAPFDSLWAVPLMEPRALQGVRIESGMLNATPEPPDRGASPQSARDWVMQASFAGPFFRMPQGGWVMQTWGVRPDGRVRGIVRFNDDGSQIWELTSAPELITVNPESGLLVLWDPDGLDPARLILAREVKPRR